MNGCLGYILYAKDLLAMVNSFDVTINKIFLYLKNVFFLPDVETLSHDKNPGMYFAMDHNENDDDDDNNNDNIDIGNDIGMMIKKMTMTMTSKITVTMTTTITMKIIMMK